MHVLFCISSCQDNVKTKTKKNRKKIEKHEQKQLTIIVMTKRGRGAARYETASL